MTLHQLLNTCNADPDIEITVYKPNGSFYPEHSYEGKYEDLDPKYYNDNVHYFRIVKLIDRGYRTDIARMDIYLAHS